MSEVVEEMPALGLLARFPDPKDGRGKVIVRSQKGLELHARVMAAFAQLDTKLADLAGSEVMERLRATAGPAAEAIRARGT